MVLECPHLRAQLAQAKQIAKLRCTIAYLAMEKSGYRMEIEQHKRSVEYAIRHEDEQHDMVAARIDALSKTIGNMARTFRDMAARCGRPTSDPQTFMDELSGELWEASKNLDDLQKEELSGYHQWLSERPKRLQDILLAGFGKASIIEEGSDDEIPELKESTDEASQ